MMGEIKGVDHTLIQGTKVGRQTAKSDAATPSGTPNKTAPTDTVELTDTAAKLRALEARLAELPVVDEDRVAALRTAIAEGRYDVDPGDIAAKLVELESALADKS